MTTQAAKGRTVFSLAAVCVVAVLLAPSPASATRTAPSLLAPSLAAPAAHARPAGVAGEPLPALPLYTTVDVVTLGGASSLEADQVEAVVARQRYRLHLLSSQLARSDGLEWGQKTATGLSSSLGADKHLERRDLRPESHGPSYQGLWTDPTTGLSYARNRWYDARTASWLSEDPLGPVDSPNLYAFVGWGPHMGTDPMGECFTPRCLAYALQAWGMAKDVMASPGTAVAGAAKTTAGMVGGALDFALLGTPSTEMTRVRTFLGTEGTLTERAQAANVAADEQRLNVLTLGFSGAEDKLEHAGRLLGTRDIKSGSGKFGTGLSEMDLALMVEGLGEIAEGTGKIAGWTATAYGVGSSVRAPAGSTTIPREAAATARISEAGGGVYGHQVMDRLAAEAQGALSQANRMLIAGNKSTPWSRLYQGVRGSGRWFESMARRNALHQLAERQLLGNRYYLEAQEAGNIIQFNKGSALGLRGPRGGLLRPDIQVGLTDGRWGVIDWTTEGSAFKIFNYSDSKSPFLINVTLE